MRWITGKVIHVWISLNEQIRRIMFIFLVEEGKLVPDGNRFISRPLSFGLW